MLQLGTSTYELHVLFVDTSTLFEILLFSVFTDTQLSDCSFLIRMLYKDTY